MCSIAGAQEDRNKLYSETLDAIFSTGLGLSPEHPAILVIRFYPSFSPESQLSLDFTDTGVAASYVKLAAMLSTTLDNLPSGRKDPREIASKIKVEKVSKTFDAKIAKQDLDSLWEALAKSPSRMKERVSHIMVDGTNYKISIDTYLDSVVVQSWDADPEPDRVTGSSEIVRWANRMRINVTK